MEYMLSCIKCSLKTSTMNKLFTQAPRFWYQKNLLSRIISYLLLPFSFLYLAIVAVRRFCYLHGFLKTTAFSVPIIVVGNIVAGGTGKTPLVIWLAQFLQQHGYKVGIVSRGYGSKRSGSPLLVNVEGDPQMVGDEALLIVRQTQCPMFVAKNRVNAVRELLKYVVCDVVLSDDGLQHYALGRAVEIAIVDGVRGFGNGFCLPAGQLREPIARLKKVAFVVKNGGSVTKDGKYVMHFVPEKLHNLQRPNLTKELGDLRGKEVHAMAGIGNPSSFFQLLRSHGIIVHEHAFPDHHDYVASDLDFDGANESAIIMTAKDAVKCERFARENCWVLPIKAEMSEAFAQDLLHLLRYPLVANIK